MHQFYDIVIIGAGPAGLTLATLLTDLNYRIKIIDNRPTPTSAGRADGLQPYTLSLLKSMGLKKAIMAHGPARVYQVAFWDPQPGGKGIHRTGTAPSCPERIEARYPFTTTLHQGLIERAFIEKMREKGVSVQRPWTITGFENEGGTEEYPVRVELKHVETKENEVVRAKYLFDAEGARSLVRERLGIRVVRKEGEKHVWGVMDGVVRTDFPDAKIKCTIHSDYGSIMIIPRENNLIRLYIQLASSGEEEFDTRRRATQEEVQAAAKKILQPYFIEWDKVEWYSNYPISQGIAEKYTLDHRIFFGGDCCHTHSPKAGQGMNTAFHDALNLAWKIHHVESGFAHRRLLHTYELERKAIAETLLDFDAKYAALFSQRTSPPTSSLLKPPNPSSSTNYPQPPEKEDSNAFLTLFKSSQLFTSGYGIIYPPSTPLTILPPPNSTSHSLNLPYPPPGAPLPRTTVTHLSDARPTHLEQALPFNGTFNILIFAGAPTTTPALTDFCTALQTTRGLLTTKSFTKPTSRATNPLCTLTTIFTSSPTPPKIPPLLSHPSLKDRLFTDTHTSSSSVRNPAHAKMGFSPPPPSSASSSAPAPTTTPPAATAAAGGIVLLRPDTHVACSIALWDGARAMEGLMGYLRGAGYFVGGATGVGGGARL